MLMILLIAMAVILGIVVILGLSLMISKAINGIFFSIFGNLYFLVRLIVIIKKFIIVGLIFKLFKKEKGEKAEKAQ